MSTVKNNIITEGLSGKIGDKYTFVQMGNGKTVLRRIAKVKTEATPEQTAVREKFRLVSQQVSEALQDPEQRIFFTSIMKKDSTLWGTAFKHFYNLEKEATE